MPRVICTGCSMPCALPTSSTWPTARSTAGSGSWSRPYVSARWKSTSESVEPVTASNSTGSMASRLDAHACMQGLIDEPVIGAVEQLVDEDGLPVVGVPATHESLQISGPTQRASSLGAGE